MSIEEYQQISDASSGVTFAGHYHHFSEGLFVDAAELLSLGDVAIDAGCYEGSNALAFARSVGTTGKVFTFEPDPRLYQRASDRIASGEEGASSISLTNFALGDEEGDVEFLIVNEIEGHSGLAPKASYGREVTYTRVQRRLRKLDNFLAEKDIDLSKVKAIKFDLEGAELKAFRGARGTIAAGSPMIMFEYGALEAFGFKPSDYFDFFSSLNYQIVSCFDTDVTSSEAMSQLFGWNLFALPRTNPYIRGDISRLIARSLPTFLERLQSN